MKQSRYDSTDKNAEQGIGKAGKESLKFRHILKRSNGGLHRFHADEQNAKTEGDLTDGLFSSAGDEHIEDNADDGEDRSQKRGLEKLE